MDGCSPTISWFSVTGELIDKFAAEHGDDNPPHIDAGYAKRVYGARDRFMHGALIGVKLSTYARQHFGDGTMVKKAGEQNFSQFFCPGDGLGFSHDGGRIRPLTENLEYISGTVVTIWHRDGETGKVKAVHQFAISLCRPIASAALAA